MKHVLPADSTARKHIPLGTGVLDYFSAALAEVAKVSFAGNAKHNPGQPLHWSRGKSADHADCLIRHFVDRGTIDPGTGVRATAEMAWRALALLQEEMEAAGAPPSRASRFPPAEANSLRELARLGRARDVRSRWTRLKDGFMEAVDYLETGWR